MIIESTTPITIAAQNATTIDRNRAINAAANDEITKNVNVVGSNATKSANKIPATPDNTPHPNHAAASTRRTGTPNVAVISRSFAIARIAVPNFENRKNAPVTTVNTTPTANPITSVHDTCTSPTLNPLLSVGKLIARDCPPDDGHNKSINPNKINNTPNVAAAFTNGSRPANTGPNTIPYPNVTTPPNTTHTTYANHSFICEPLINCHEINAPNAPTAPNDKFNTPVARNNTTIPTPDNAYTPPNANPVTKNG